MELFLIDAIGPFFRDYRCKRTNWSKIPFQHLDTASPELWAGMLRDLDQFASRIREEGYNAVSLDDLAHLAPHPLHEPEVAARIKSMREKFANVLEVLTVRHGLKVFLTSDVLPLTPAITEALGGHPEKLDDYYLGLVRGILDDYPQLSGLILRVGESDGHDVKDPIRTRLHLRDATTTNRLLRRLLPEFESRNRELIFRTWTVGAYRIGDLIWHRDTLESALRGLDSPNLIVSMKHGESDFFRYLPLNKAFYRVKQRKIIELQARREYEGAGEYPSFIGWECEAIATSLEGVQNMAGISVWCQTGGWHRFHRRAYLDGSGSDVWIRFNTAAAIAVFQHGSPAEQAIRKVVGPASADAALALLRHSETVIRDLLYIGDFARQKWFFRRVRVPPLLHVYWDSLFINRGLRQLLRHFVKDHRAALDAGESAFACFPKMITLARQAGLPAEDIEHMRDFFRLILLARRYYFQTFDQDIASSILREKKSYKHRWPKETRARYRIKTSFDPVPINRRSIRLTAWLLLRQRRGYRWLDRIFTLHLTGIAFRIVRNTRPSAIPKLLRKSAMGVETLFK